MRRVGRGGRSDEFGGGLHLVLPEDQGPGDRLRYAFLVPGIVDGAWVAVLGSEFEDEGGAGEGVNGPDGGSAAEEGDVGAAKGGSEGTLELLAGGNPGGLGGEPGEGCGFGGSGVEFGAVEVNAGSAAGCMQEQARGSTGVVGDAGAVVEGEGCGSAIGGGLLGGGVESRVRTTVKPRAVRRVRRRKARARVTFFSRRLSPMREPESAPPWAGSRTMMSRLSVVEILGDEEK